MRFLTVSALILLPAAAFAQNSSNYLTTVLGALTAANLTSLVTTFSAVANTTEGMALLTQLGSGNKTVFAPSNMAFANVSSMTSMNTTLLSQILSYHILNNTYTVNGTQVASNHTIAHTLLKGEGYMLPGNFSAPLVLDRSSMSAQSFMISQAMDNVTVMGPVMASNLQVYVINELLSLPGPLSSLATTLNLTALGSVLNTTGLLKPLESSAGITVFAPSNAAITAAGPAIAMLNATQLTTVLGNHVINGSVVYSPMFGSNYTSAEGSPMSVMSNSTGMYVMSGNVTAKVIQSDVIINNGVVHLIDNVLSNTMMDMSAASAAYSSGMAAAATMTLPTGAVTATSAMEAAAATGTSGASSNGKTSSAGTVASVHAALGAVGLLAGGVLSMM